MLLATTRSFFVSRQEPGSCLLNFLYPSIALRSGPHLPASERVTFLKRIRVLCLTAASQDTFYFSDAYCMITVKDDERGKYI